MSGPAARAVGEAIGLGDTAVTIWSIAKWPVLLGLAAVVVAILIFLLWLRITHLALLFGAELNAEMERGRQLQAGIPAEDDLQLPPRDTRVIKKNAAKDARDFEQGQQLRNSRGDSSTPAGS